MMSLADLIKEHGERIRMGRPAWGPRKHYAAQNPGTPGDKNYGREQPPNNKETAMTATATTTTETTETTRKNNGANKAQTNVDALGEKFVEVSNAVTEAAVAAKTAAESVTALAPQFAIRKQLGALAVGGAAGAVVGGAAGGLTMTFALAPEGRSTEKTLAGIAVGAGVGVPVGVGLAALLVGYSERRASKKEAEKK